MEHQDLYLPNDFSNLAVSPNGNYLAVGGKNGSLFVFDLIEFTIEEILAGEHTTPIIGSSWDPNHGSRLATID